MAPSPHLVRAALAAALALLPAAQAVPFRVASAFGPNMVLQADVPTSVWGFANPGQVVYTSLFNTATNMSDTATGTADATGLWVATLPAGPAGLDVYTLTASTQPISQRCNTYAFSCEGSSISFTGIVRGTVFLCIGQSNMQVNVGFAFNATAELELANSIGYLVRVFQVYANAQSKDGPLDDFAGPPFIPWSPASNTTLPEFSATCWYSAKQYLLTRPTDQDTVPIGLVASTWGGTPIKAYTTAATNQACAPLYPPGVPTDCGLFHAPCNASVLYNSMLHPLTAGPMRFSAMVWFQGENDTGEGAAANDLSFPFYACQLKGLATDLRQLLDSPLAHWTTVQLAPYHGGSALPYFRAMQCAATAQLPNASCAVIVDDGDPLSPIGDVHSRNKELVGRRVAAGWVAGMFGKDRYGDAQSTGPTYLSAAVSASPDGSMLYANVTLAPASLGPAGQLVYVPPHVDTWQNSSRCPTEILPQPLNAYCDWLSIWGSDGVAYNATTAEVWAGPGGAVGLALAAPVVPSPVPGIRATGTRFGWGQWPVVNFYNAYGFPLVPWNETAV